MLLDRDKGARMHLNLKAGRFRLQLNRLIELTVARLTLDGPPFPYVSSWPDSGGLVKYADRLSRSYLGSSNSNVGGQVSCWQAGNDLDNHTHVLGVIVRLKLPPDVPTRGSGHGMRWTAPAVHA